MVAKLSTEDIERSWPASQVQVHRTQERLAQIAPEMEFVGAYCMYRKKGKKYCKTVKVVYRCADHGYGETDISNLQRDDRSVCVRCGRIKGAKVVSDNTFERTLAMYPEDQLEQTWTYYGPRKIKTLAANGICHKCNTPFGPTAVHTMNRGHFPCMGCARREVIIDGVLRDKELGGMVWESQYEGYVLDLKNGYAKIGLGGLKRARHNGERIVYVTGPKLNVMYWEQEVLRRLPPVPPSVSKEMLGDTGWTEVKRYDDDLLPTVFAVAGDQDLDVLVTRSLRDPN